MRATIVLVALLGLVSCAKENDKGTCVSRAGTSQWCTVNAERWSCKASPGESNSADFTNGEPPKVGLAHCRALGFIIPLMPPGSSSAQHMEALERGEEARFVKP